MMMMKVELHQLVFTEGTLLKTILIMQNNSMIMKQNFVHNPISSDLNSYDRSWFSYSVEMGL